MNSIDSLAYSSRIAQVDPKGKICFALTAMILCILFDSLILSVITVVLTGAMTIQYTKLSIRRYLHFLSIPAGFLLIGVGTIIISKYAADDTLLIGITIGTGRYGITEESLTEGIRLALRSLGAVSALYFLSFNTPMISLFQSLRETRIPLLVVSLMELIYRYIFVLWEEAQKMKVAQESRLGYCDFKTAIRSTGTLIGTLFFRAYERCDRTYAALESRGYEGDFEMLEEEYLPCNRFYWNSLFLILVFLAIKAMELYLGGKLPWK